MIDLAKELRAKLAKGAAVAGPFAKTCDPAFVEVVGRSGFDFIILDGEHGPQNPYSLQNLIRGAEVSGVCPIVRVDTVGEIISRVLDVGAAGVQIPQITTRAEAEAAIAYAKFYPQGERGVCRYVRAANYSSMDKFSYFQEANENLVILQLEGQKALQNMEEILSVPGIDIIFIGPYDLSQSLGLTGQVTHPQVEEKMREIIAACKQQGIAVGTFSDTIENARKWREAGVQYLSYAADVGIFYEACVAKYQELTR